MVKINEYIESGILEAYLLGSASEAETTELLYLKAKHPQIQDALQHLELEIEEIAQHMAIKPPPNTWAKIEDRINELAKTPVLESMPIKRPPKKDDGAKSDQFIHVDASSSHMRVHKIWRWLFIGVFILGKIFLGFAIYFYLENRQLKKEINRLEAELKTYRTPR